jgi:hypothetical protein
MDVTTATQTIIALGLLLLFMRALNGLIVQIVAIMLRTALVGAALLLLPWNVIDDWARQATEAADLGPKFVPVMAVLAITALTLGSLPLIGDTKVEEMLRVVIYIIGGVYTAGSVPWVNLDKYASLIVVGLFGMLSAVIAIFQDMFTSLSKP